jgi:hypothetical protein
MFTFQPIHSLRARPVFRCKVSAHSPESRVYIP